MAAPSAAGRAEAVEPDGALTGFTCAAVTFGETTAAARRPIHSDIN